MRVFRNSGGYRDSSTVSPGRLRGPFPLSFLFLYLFLCLCICLWEYEYHKWQVRDTLSPSLGPRDGEPLSLRPGGTSCRCVGVKWTQMLQEQHFLSVERSLVLCFPSFSAKRGLRPVLWRKLHGVPDTHRLQIPPSDLHDDRYGSTWMGR